MKPPRCAHIRLDEDLLLIGIARLGGDADGIRYGRTMVWRWWWWIFCKASPSDCGGGGEEKEAAARLGEQRP
jgi:hypothetical protein